MYLFTIIQYCICVYTIQVTKYIFTCVPAYRITISYFGPVNTHTAHSIIDADDHCVTGIRRKKEKRAHSAHLRIHVEGNIPNAQSR